MKRVDPEKLPACGYGLLGLCCSACLLGPCRISPFESDSAKGLCGDTSDRIAARNLLRMVARETLEGLSFLRKSSEGLASPGFNPGRDVAKAISEKYSLSPRIRKNGLSRSLFREIEKILSPFPQGQSAFIKGLLPERAFPYFYPDSFQLRSLTSLLFDWINGSSTETPDTDKMLQQCLHLSVVPLICEELGQDIHDLVCGERLSRRDEQLFEILNRVKNPSPVILFLSDQKDSSNDWIRPMARELEKSLKGEAITLFPEGFGTLLKMGRRLSEKWSLSVAEVKIVTIVSSSLATRILGPLALGFSVISHPLLPVHGSKRVEKFFSEGLRKRYGNAYLLSRKEEISGKVLEFLRRSV